jgi:phage baseplate assembly protein gpV
MKTNGKRNDEGMALLVAMVFLIMMGLLATWATTRVMDNTRHVDAYVDYQNTFEGLEAGLGQAKAEVNSGGDGMVGVNPAFDFANGNPTWADPMVAPQSMTTAPEIQYFAYAINWANDGFDNNGDGLVDVGAELNGYYSMYAFARAARFGNVSVQRGTEEVVQGIDVNVWQNAIFAGTGQAGMLINGNVAIHGSVHLLGDDIGAGGVAIAALDLSGTSLIHNNYDGLSADLAGRVPALGTTLFNGQNVGTLNATLRVKSGLVGMSGNSEIGEPDNAGNTWKETMDGVYVTDGWTGNAIDGNGDPTSVYSDNGWENMYDLGNAVPFPTYDDDGGQDHLDYYLETDPDPTKGLQQVYVGNITIQPGGGNYYWNATTGTEAVDEPLGANGMPNKADLDNDEYYIWFDDATDTMVINGRIPVEGNINLTAGNGAGNTLINYEGKGTMLAYDPNDTGGGDVTIDASLKTTNFPDTNLFGIHAQDDMSIGVSSQLEIMGGFYAQDGVIVDKQTTIMGTIVGNYFDMGTNVPKIYQVPALSSQWTGITRMIGSDPVLFLSPVSWRELAII